MNTEKRLKVLLLGASFNTMNMGVSALAAGAIKAVKHVYPDADVTLMDYSKEGETYNFRLLGKQILIPLINIRFSKKFYLSNNIAFLLFQSLIFMLLPFRPIRNALLSNSPCLKHVYEADIVASIAGGDSFSDIYGVERFLYVTLPQVLAVFMGKSLVQLPQTIGPFNGWLAKKMAKYVMENSSVIYSRDYSGMLDAREALGLSCASGKVRFCHDLAFIVDPVKAEDAQEIIPEPHKPLIGLNVSGLLYLGGYTRDNMFHLKSDYRELVYDLIDFLINQKKAQVVLVPHVFGGVENVESDSAACEAIYETVRSEYNGSLHIVRGKHDHGGIKHIIGAFDLFIGSRMHACIAAASQNVPSVSIAYSKKFAGVMETIGLEEYVADPCRLDKDAVIDVVDRAFKERDKIRKGLESSIPKAKESVLALFGEIPL